MSNIVVLIPCFNEVEGIPQLCTRLSKVLPELGKDTEVVFVDDGSTDGTSDLIRREAASFRHRIIVHEHNKGIGAAFKTGLSAIDADIVVTMDSDCTYDPERISELLTLLRDGNDIVTGSPYHPEGEVVGVPGWRLMLSRSLSLMYWCILPQRLYTYTSCFRAYRGTVIPKLSAESDGFLGVAQLLVSGILNGAKVAELPAKLTRRQFGQSKIKIVRVILSHLGYIAHLVVQQVRRHILRSRPTFIPSKPMYRQ